MKKRKINCIECKTLMEPRENKVILPVYETLIEFEVQVCTECDTVTSIPHKGMRKIIRVLQDKKLV